MDDPVGATHATLLLKFVDYSEMIGCVYSYALL